MHDLAASRYSEKVDIYSLGVVLWEIVTGLMPEVRQADAVNTHIQGRRVVSVSCTILRMPAAAGPHECTGPGVWSVYVLASPLRVPPCSAGPFVSRQMTNVRRKSRRSSPHACSWTQGGGPPPGTSPGECCGRSSTRCTSSALAM